MEEEPSSPESSTFPDELNKNKNIIKELLYDHIERVLVPEESLEHWYSIARKLMKNGKYANAIKRDEAVRLGSLHLHATFGDWDANNFKQGLSEKRRNSFIHPKFRKDPKFIEHIYLEYQKLKGMDKNQAKRRYINIVRVLKRASENVFVCYLYYADKVETVTIRKILLIISERVIIMDAVNQVVVNDIPIDAIRSLNNHHTSATDREIFKTARKKFNNGDKMHLLVIDLGVTSVSLLTENRTAIRNNFETCLNGFWRAQKQVYSEKLEKMAPPEKIVSIKDLNAKKFSKSTKYLIQSENDDLREVKLQFVDGHLLVSDSTTEVMFIKLELESIHSWRRSRIPKETRHKIESGGLSSIDKNNLEQIIIVCPANVFRIYGDITALQNKMQKVFLRQRLLYKREYECWIQGKNNKFREVTAKLTDKEISFHDLLDQFSTEIIPSSDIVSLKTNAVPELREKYESITKVLILELANGSNIIVGSDDTTIQTMEQEIQNIILLLWRNFKKLEEHKKKIALHGVPCKLFSRNKAKTCDVSFRISNEDNFVIQDDDQDILIQVPINQISGWVFGFNLANSSEGVLLFSKKSVDEQYHTLENMIGTLQENYADHIFESSSDSEMY
jgi:hypothetical protein